MKDYDQKCKMCDQGCHHHQFGQFQDGRKYEACRYYGYILHKEKGVSQEVCEGYITDQFWNAMNKKKKKKDEPIPESVLQKRRLVEEYLKSRKKEQ